MPRGLKGTAQEQTLHLSNRYNGTKKSKISGTFPQKEVGFHDSPMTGILSVDQVLELTAALPYAQSLPKSVILALYTQWHFMKSKDGITHIRE